MALSSGDVLMLNSVTVNLVFQGFFCMCVCTLWLLTRLLQPMLWTNLKEQDFILSLPPRIMKFYQLPFIIVI